MDLEESKGNQVEIKEDRLMNTLDKSDLTFNMRCSPQGSLRDQSSNEENEPD